MPKKVQILDLTSKEPLIDRQSKLWNISDQIDLANYYSKPLPAEIGKWLFYALRAIARGEDANKVLDVLPEKKGVRKDSFAKRMDRKLIMGATAASKQYDTSQNTNDIIDKVTTDLPVIKNSTAKRIWNSKSTERKPVFTLGGK